MKTSISKKKRSNRQSLVYFALSSDFGGAISNVKFPVSVFHDYMEYDRDRPDPYCFVIGSRNTDKALKLIQKLRANVHLAIRPMFLLTSLGDAVDRISDGVVHTLDEAFERAKEINQRLQELDQKALTDSADDTFRLIGHLYARDGYILQASASWQHEHYYTYPLVDAMFEVSDSIALVNNLSELKLLEPAQLVDRLRHCPQCEGTHLNYVDICPQCASIDITRKPFLHCYTCGHVAPEERYLVKGALSCPNCATRLRHIGADYDRPLENHQCNSCHHIFIDPEILAHCMHCQSKTAPQDLSPKPVYAYQLSEKGKLVAETGDLDDVFSLLDKLNPESVDYFTSILDWLLSLCRRHGEEHFSLIGIRIKNVAELTNKLGRGKITELMDEFVRRVRDLIRGTDLTTRTNRYTFWLLLPKTDVAGNKVVLGRIFELTTRGEAGLELETTSYHSPSQALAGEDAKLLMARLEGEISE